MSLVLVDFGRVPKILGQSRVLGTVPKTQNPNMWTHNFSILKDPSILGLSLVLGILAKSPRSWNSPINPESRQAWHIIFKFSPASGDCPGLLGISGESPRCWDSIGSSGQSQKPRIPTCVTHNFSILKDQATWDCPGLLWILGGSPRSLVVPKTMNPDMCDTSIFNSQRPQCPGTVPGSWGFRQSPQGPGTAPIFGLLTLAFTPSLSTHYCS